MFGYVKPLRPEMKIREYDAYKAIYCGLCRELGSSFGPFSRFTLSYDFTFLAMLGLELMDEEPGFGKAFCPANPVKKCVCVDKSEPLRFSACCAMVMIYYKALDNIQDKGFKNKLLSRLALPFFGRARKKAMGQYPEVDAIVARMMESQRQLEADRCDSIDQACEPTALALAGICELLSQDEKQKRILNRLGYLIGRYVYLCDALEDLKDDHKKGNYNPYLIRNNIPPDAGDAELDAAFESLKEQAVGSLYLTIAEAANTYELLAAERFSPIVENILYLGLRATVDEITSKGGRTDGPL